MQKESSFTTSKYHINRSVFTDDFDLLLFVMSTYGRPPPNSSGMVSLKVDNVTYRTTPSDLERVFSRYGEVGDLYIPRDHVTKESRGFAFVRFLERRDAEDAMDAMDGADFDGRELRVQEAKYGRPNESRRPYSNYYNRGDRGYGAGGGGGRGYYGGGQQRNSYGRSSRRGRSRSRSRSPRRRRSYSRSPSRSRSRSRRRSPSRSKSRTPERRSSHSRRSNSRSKSRSPQRDRSTMRDRSPKRSRSRSAD